FAVIGSLFDLVVKFSQEHYSLYCGVGVLDLSGAILRCSILNQHEKDIVAEAVKKRRRARVFDLSGASLRTLLPKQ
ncbi:hypothetical protein MKW98_008299, partial [Papaver atlanticum]